MIINTKRLTLNTERSSSLACYIEWLNDQELMKYSEQRHQKHDHYSQLKYVRSFDQVTSFWWEICPHTFPPIGSITAYTDPYNETADVGILIGAMGMRGYGTEAWQAICDWLLREHPIRKIEAGCMASNEAMIKIFGRTGMVIESRRKAHFLLDGKPEDLIQAARFSEKWL